MAESALIERLHHQAQARIALVWETARADAAAFRAEHARAVEAERTRAAAASAERAADFRRITIGRAEAEARQIRTIANASTASRLYAAAVDRLGRLGDAAGDGLFDALAREIPPRAYEQVIVNPKDVGRARARFAGTRVVADPRVAGGLEVEAEGGRVRISNTLAARLDAAWPELLCQLMHDAIEVCRDS